MRWPARANYYRFMIYLQKLALMEQPSEVMNLDRAPANLQGRKMFALRSAIGLDKKSALHASPLELIPFTDLQKLMAETGLYPSSRRAETPALLTLGRGFGRPGSDWALLFEPLGFWGAVCGFPTRPLVLFRSSAYLVRPRRYKPGRGAMFHARLES